MTILRAVIFLVFLVCVAVPSDGGESKGADASIPVWRSDVVQDLKDLGRNPPGVAFLDDSQLIVHQVTLDAHQLSSRKSPDISSPFRLRISVMDVSSGKVTSAKEWGTRFHDSSVHVTSGGVVARTGDLIRLFSKNLVEIKQIPLSNDPTRGLEIRVSTSGKTVLLNRYHVKQRERTQFSDFDVLDGDTLKRRASWAESPGVIDNYAITDNVIATNWYKNGHGTVLATEFGSAVWNPLFEVSQGLCSPGQSTVFVTDNLLVCAFQDFVMSSTKGEVLMTDHFVKGEGKRSQIVVAQNGRCAAVMLENYTDFWDTGGHITSLRAAVYNLSAKKRVMTVRVSPPPKHDYDVALSPDGSKLAILNDGAVSVYSVPIQ